MLQSQNFYHFSGQQLAAQMQATNPQLVEQLRQHMTPNPNVNNSNENKPG